MEKRKRFLPVLLLTACMLAATLWAVWNQSGDLLGQVQFQDSRHGQELDLFYDQEADSYVLFLPGFTDPQDITYSAPRGVQVTYDFASGATEPTVLEISGLLHRQQFSMQLMRLSDYPTLFIHAEEGLIPYLNEDKDNARDVVVQFLDGQGSKMLQSTASMYGRGNGSWESPSKKPYNLEFSQPISVGPFQDVTKLCLLAEFSDESRMRNSLAYYAGQELGIDYASPYQYTNVYVNGEFLGLYGMVTKQEFQKHLDEDNIQAVFEIATAHNRVEFDSSLGWRINVIHGSKGQVQRIVNGFEDALRQDDWAACETYIHTESFAQKYALEEFLANLDLAYGSQYFYVDGNDKIHCMLPWDYDWTLGSSYTYYNNRQVYELKVHRDSDSWYAMLLEYPPFREATVQVWEQDFDDAFLKKLEDHLQSDIAAIAGSWACDVLRWKQELPYNQYDLSSGVTELEGFYSLFRDYFYQRREFLTSYFSHQENYSRVYFYGARWGNFFLPKGSHFWDYMDGATVLDVYVPGEIFLGWHAGDVPVAGVDLLTDDLALLGDYVEEPPEAPAASLWWLELGLVGIFFSLALILLLKMYHAVKRKEPHSCPVESEVV